MRLIGVPLFLLTLDLAYVGGKNHYEENRFILASLKSLYNSSLLLRSSPGISQTGSHVEDMLSVAADLYESGSLFIGHIYYFEVQNCL